uniref:Uncharacterized protein n=1 Tax=Ixodes scapularis TaxID=6945 RepID=A0A4D5RCE7_IXOSC
MLARGAFLLSLPALHPFAPLPPSFSSPYLLELLPTIVSDPPKEFCLKDSRDFVFLLLFTQFLSLRLCGTSLASFQLWYKLVICLLSLVSG